VSKIEGAVAAWVTLCATLMVLLCWIGIVRDYHPLPFWDSWDSLVPFVLEFPAQNWGDRFNSLVEQHNEHRILLTRLLFLADGALFNSSFVLLYAFNALIPLLGVWVMVRTAAGESRFVKWIIAGLSCGFLFLLLQRENFGWEFQSQFFLAFYLPLLGYFLVFRLWSDALWKNAVLVGSTALMCMFTMANGALYAVPIALFFVWKRETRALALISAGFVALILVVYLRVLPYDDNPHHGSFARDVLPYLARYVAFVLTYIGRPFTGMEQVMQAFGLLFVLLTLRLTWQALRRDSLVDPRNALLLFILYYLMTVAVTGIGRVNFGVIQALSGRYLTPTLLAWLCLVVLGLLNMSSTRWKRLVYFGVLPVIALAGVSAQHDEYKETGNRDAERDRARLALHMGAADADAMEILHPSVELVIAEFERSRLAGLHFTVPPEAWTRLGDPVTATSDCDGGVLSVERLDGDFVRINGWIVGSGDSEEEPAPVIVADGRIVGLSVIGQHLAEAPERFRNRGFVAYVPNFALAEGIAIHGSATAGACALPLDIAN